MVNLLQMIFQLFKGSLTFKKLVNDYFGGPIEAFYWSANRVAVIGNHHRKNQLVNTWEKCQGYFPWVLPSKNTHFTVVQFALKNYMKK